MVLHEARVNFLHERLKLYWHVFTVVGLERPAPRIKDAAQLSLMIERLPLREDYRKDHSGIY